MTAEAHAGVGPRYVLVGVTSWSWHCAVAHPIPDVFARQKVFFYFPDFWQNGKFQILFYIVICTSRVTTALGWIEAVSGIKPCCPPSPPEWEP